MENPYGKKNKEKYAVILFRYYCGERSLNHFFRALSLLSKKEEE